MWLEGPKFVSTVARREYAVRLIHPEVLLRAVEARNPPCLGVLSRMTRVPRDRAAKQVIDRLTTRRASADSAEADRVQ